MVTGVSLSALLSQMATVAFTFSLFDKFLFPLSDIDRNTHPSPTGLAGSEGSLRRAVRASGCCLCGDCKYVSLQRKTLGKQGQKSRSPGPEQPTCEVKIKEENRDPEASQKINIWISQYPKVTLCDIAQNCDAFSQDCGYMLPDVLKTKVVHCFKQEMRAGFRFEPGCLGHNKHKSEDGALAKNGEICPRIQSERSICQSQSLTEHQRHLKECTDAQTLSSRTTCHFPKSWTSEGSATCSASFLLGKRAKKGECRTDMWDRDVGEDPRPGSHFTGADILTDKRIKLVDSVKDRVLPSTLALECITCKNPAKTEKTCSWISDDSQSCAEHAAGSSSTFGSAVKENHVHKKPCGEIDSPTNTDAAQMSSELFCLRNQGEMDELESFTCQRVRAYFRKNHFSCARTYMPWPFSNSVRTLTAHTVTPACPAEPIDPSANSDSPINRNKPGTPSNCTYDMLPPKDTTQQVSHQNDGKGVEDGESLVAERNGKRHDNMSLYSPDSTNIEFAPHSMVAEESLAGPPSDIIELATASDSSLPVNGPQTDSSMSTPSPSAIGLSDWETATTLSSMSSPSTNCGLSSVSATLSFVPPLSFLPRKVKSVDLADASSLKCMVKPVEKPLLYCEETRMTSLGSSSAPSHNSDSFQSCESSLLLPQDKNESDEERLTDRGPPKLEPYYNTSPINYDLLKERLLHKVLLEKCVESEFMLPPMLSPVTSPHGRSRTSLLPQSRGYSDEEEEEEIDKGTCKRKSSPGSLMPQIVNDNNENSKDDLEHGIEESDGVSTNVKPLTTPREPRSSPSNDKDLDDSNEEESQDETDCEDDVEQGNKKSEQVPSDPKIRATLTTGVLTEPHSSPSSDEDDGGTEGWSPSEMARGERDHTKAEAAGDTEQGILDEFTAFEQDILLVDVIQDDPELFENLPQKSLLKLGPIRVTEAPKTRPIGVVKKLLQRSHGASLDFEQR